ncbi:neuropeptide FF receptor 2 [Drosophila willistoni]|nr:neuropeptide FF receptor 2 [Drosophila willistoni]
MALLHYTYEELQYYLKYIVNKNTTSTENYANDVTYPGILISDLSQINIKKRSIFMGIVGALFLLAFLGNLSTLYVNSRRKLRPFFRACLISLACSDLMSCVFSTIAYIAQFKAEYLQLWTLGDFMCKFVPFITTAAVLASSLTLVAIAFDRYMAIMRAVLGFWNPDVRICVICMAGIWLASMGTSGPLFTIYDLDKIYLLELDEPQLQSNQGEGTTTAMPTTEDLLVTELELVSMCITGDHDVGLYYVILFGLIFLPCIVAFIWLNTIIARQLWLRRHYHHHQQQPEQEQDQVEARVKMNNVELLMPSAMMSALSVAAPFNLDKMGTTLPPPPPPKPTVSSTPPTVGAAALAREQRHRRMVLVVLLMMAVFICLRLPAWIFLIMRLYGSFSTPVDWLLYFSFGILNLTSCALNPVFYTFLTQTIRTLSYFKQKIRNWTCCGGKGLQDEAMPTEPTDPGKKWGFGVCCGLRHITITWRCYPDHNLAKATSTEIPNDAMPQQPSGQIQGDPSSLQFFYNLKHDIYAIYNQNESSLSASIESSV